HLEMGKSAELKAGDWCMVVAHPGGFKPGRTPPVRLGRVLQAGSTTLTTDCILVGGDSGGPLFDMTGTVIGINSRIDHSVNANLEGRVDPSRENWDKYAKGEVVPGRPGFLGFPGFGRNGPYLGLAAAPDGKGYVIKTVLANSPAEKAGLKVDDVVLKFDG